MLLLLLVALTTAAPTRLTTTSQLKPSGLLVDLQHANPALGVRSAPSFSWIVPPCGTDHAQTAFRIQVSLNGLRVWDHHVQAPESTSVPYSGPELEPGTKYEPAAGRYTYSHRHHDYLYHHYHHCQN